MGIADDLARAREREREYGYDGGMEIKQRAINRDEYGLRIPDYDGNPPVDYIAARVFFRNRTLYYDPEIKSICVNGVAVSETSSNLVGLCGSYIRGITGWHTLVWARIKELAPIINYDKIWISETTVYDMAEGKIEKQSPKENHI